MSKFFSKLFTNKKTLPFFFLLILTIGFSVPLIARGDILPTVGGLLGGVGGYAAGTIASFFGGKALDIFAIDVFNGVLGAVLLPFLAITAIIADYAGTYLMWTMQVITTIKYTHVQGVDIGWPIVRDLANMIIVLGFIVIGIATALRVKEYEAKQLLGKLIVVALLVNFSLLICGVFIDGTNIATNFFFKQTASVGPFGYQNILNSWNLAWNGFTNLTTGLPNLLPQIIASMCFNLISALVTVLYMVMLLARVIALWVLVILSPLAFVCYVFPATKNVWQMWWKNFSQWCIIGIPAGLFYYIGAKMQEVGASKKLGLPDFTSIPQASDPIMGMEGGKFGNDVINITHLLSGYISFIIPALFMIIGFFVALQTSAMGASAIMNFANKNKGKALSMAAGVGLKATGTAGKLLGKAGAWAGGLGTPGGAVNKIGKAAGGVFGAYGKAGEAISNVPSFMQKRASATGKLLAKIGAIKEGTQQLADKSRIDTEAKLTLAAYVSGDESAKASIVARAKNGDAAAIQAIASEGDLGKHFVDPTTGKADIKTIDKLLSGAEKDGASRNVRKTAEQEIPELAARNTETVNDLKSSLGINQADAEKMAVSNAFSKYKVEGLKDLSNDNLATLVKGGGATGSKALEQLTENGGLDKLNETRVQIMGRIESAENVYGSKVRGSAMKQDPNLETDDDKLAKIVRGMDKKGLAEKLNASAVTEKVLGAMSSQQITYMANNASLEKRDAFKKLVNSAAGGAAILQRIQDLQNAGRTEDANNLQANFAKAQITFR